jgi:hypothetical protein
MTRRDFFRFVVLGGIVGYFGRRLKSKNLPKKAMFWRKSS